MLFGVHFASIDSFPHPYVENYFFNPLYSEVYGTYPHCVGNYTLALLDRSAGAPYLARTNGIAFNSSTYQIILSDRLAIRY